MCGYANGEGVVPTNQGLVLLTFPSRCATEGTFSGTSDLVVNHLVGVLLFEGQTLAAFCFSACLMAMPGQSSSTWRPLVSQLLGDPVQPVK